MTYKIRTFTPDDYKTYSSWLDMRKRPIPAFKHLPAAGWIAHENGTDYAAGFISPINTDQCSIQHFASNPMAENDKRGPALEALLDAMIDIAKDRGFSFVAAAANKQKFLDRLSARKFVVYDTNITQMGRAV